MVCQEWTVPSLPWRHTWPHSQLPGAVALPAWLAISEVTALLVLNYEKSKVNCVQQAGTLRRLPRIAPHCVVSACAVWFCLRTIDLCPSASMTKSINIAAGFSLSNVLHSEVDEVDQRCIRVSVRCSSRWLRARLDVCRALQQRRVGTCEVCVQHP